MDNEKNKMHWYQQSAEIQSELKAHGSQQVHGNGKWTTIRPMMILILMHGWNTRHLVFCLHTPELKWKKAPTQG